MLALTSFQEQLSSGSALPFTFCRFRSVISALVFPVLLQPSSSSGGTLVAAATINAALGARPLQLVLIGKLLLMCI